jgi:hypothetical protein
VSAVEVNGNACSAALLTVPGVGLWYACVELTDAVALAGSITLRVLDTSWQGYVISGGPVDGRARYRIVAGAGGWGRELPPKAYQNDAGLTAARLISDAASEAGETVDAPPTTRLGVHFSRPRGPASFALNLLAQRAWYAREDGVVAFGARPLLNDVASQLPTVQRDPAARLVELALTDTAAGLLPGAPTEFGAAADVELELGQDGLRARLYAAPARPTRRLEAQARILDALDPARRWRALYEYRVVSQTAERLNLQPVRSRSELPDLARVPVRMGVPGVRAQHALGSQVIVAFLDGDPSRPAVVGFDSPGQPAWMPLSLELGGPEPLGVARRTDAVQAGPFGGAIVGGSLRVKASL